MTRANLRLIAICGLAAPVVYVLATGAGSVLDPAYSQLRHHVSELTASGASTWMPLAPAYVGYNLLVGVLAFALYRSERGRLFKVGAVLLVINATAGLLSVTVLRQDPGGMPSTLGGIGHLAAAAVMVVAVVASSFVYGVAFRRSAFWHPLSRFSFAIGIGMLVLGPLAAAAANSTLAGLAERGPIGLALVWLAGIGGFAATRHGSLTGSMQAGR